MALTVKAILRDSNNKALKNTKVELCFYRANGSAIIIARATSNNAGTIELSCRPNFGSYLPRVLLRAKISGKTLNLTNIPKSFSATRLDFGVVKVATAPAITLAATSFHAMPSFVASGANNSEVLRRVNTEKEALNSKLTVANKTIERKDKELKTLQLNIVDFKNQIAVLNQQGSTAGVKAAKPVKTRKLDSSKLAISAVTALEKADTNLRNQGRFRIENAKFELKVLPGSTENEVRLLENADDFIRLPPESFSSFNFDVLGNGPSAPAAGGSENKQQMPDLSGYTRTMAERKLRELNLVAEFYSQQLEESDHKLHGQIIHQYPKQKTAITGEENIVLIVGEKGA